MLARAEKVYGARWARPFACLLALSRQGWREADLEGMLPAVAGLLFRAVGDGAFTWDALQFAALRRGFRAHILQRGALGQWDFFHARARQAVLHRYLADAGEVRRLHSAIADHLLKLPEPDPLRIRETMFHLISAEDGPRAARFYAHVEQPGEATRTLAEAVVGGEEAPAYRTLQWTASLPAERGLEPDGAWRLCQRFQFDLNDAIENRARLAVRQRLLEAARESLGKLAAADPSNSAWQRDLSVSHQRLGDGQSAQGDLGGALAAYRESLAIAQRLVAADPSNSAWQRDLSFSHIKLGDVQSAQGDLGGALAAYRESLAIRQRLAAADPSNSAWQRDLWVSYWRLGSISEQSGAADAQEWWREAYQTLEGMKRRGLFVSPEDERFLAQLKAKAAGTGC
jgi:tetratricopeptide (TPR) repeat protein